MHSAVFKLLTNPFCHWGCYVENGRTVLYLPAFHRDWHGWM